MAFLRETERSLRAYFYVVGVLYVLAAMASLGDATKILGYGSIVPLRWHLAIWVPLVSRVLIGVGLIIAGALLRSSLLTGAGWIKKLLLAAVGVQILDAILVEVLMGANAESGQMARAVIGAAITGYLFHNIARLSNEARDRAGIPPAPPAARAIER